MKKQVSLLFMFLGILFVVCLILSNILAVKKIDIFGFSATAGLIIFPISYIINDTIVEVWGFRKATLIIWTGFAMNFLVVAFLQLSILLTPASFWGEQQAYASILGQTPRIAIASLFAFLTGSMINAFVMSHMKVRSHGKRFGVRAIVSTIFGETADSLIFFSVAFAGLVSWKEILVMIVVETILKSAYEVVILPVTTLTVKYIKRTEQTDVYDTNLSYGFLKIKAYDDSK